MMTPDSNHGDWQPLPNLDSRCFGCGADNPAGLKMKFETNGQAVRSRVCVPDHMRGWNNIIHGGILSTICDEIMSWSAIVLTRRFILTKNLSVSFLKPVQIGTPLTARGFLQHQSSDRHALLRGEITDPEGETVTACDGEFILFTEDQFRPLGIVPESYIRAVADAVFVPR